MSQLLLQLQQIEAKVKTLLEKNRTLQRDCEELKQENESLKTVNASQKEKIAELENHLKVMKLAKSITNGDDNDAQRNELKRKINEMIKEIDNCVALLNN